jgi:photosystem II stability/assembly factor-like uncharacterized protein
LLDEPVFTLVPNPQNPRTLYAGGLGHRLYRSYDGGRTWDTIIIDFPGGAAQFLDVFVHPRDTAVILVGGSGFGKLVRSSDGGQTWQDVLVPEHAFLLPSGASIVAHPQHPDTILLTEYIGPGWTPPRLYRTTDGGRTWDTLAVFPDPIPNCALAVRWDSLWLVVARCDGAIFASDDWQHWRLLSWVPLPGYPQESEIPDIVFVPEEPTVGFFAVTFLFDTTIGGRPNGGLYRTTDGGYTWQLVAFPDTSLWAVATHRSLAGLEVSVGGFTLYPDTLGRPLVPGSGILRTLLPERGIWQAHDESIPWLPSDPLYRRVWRLRYAPDGTLYAATEAGLYAWTSPTAVTELAPSSIRPQALVLPSAEWSVWTPCSGWLRLFRLDGREVLHHWIPQGRTRLTLHALPAGVYGAELLDDGQPCARWLLVVP